MAMSQLGEILGFGLQTVELLRYEMDGIRRPSLKERLGLNGLGCCGGARWGFGGTSMTVREGDGEGDDGGLGGSGPLSPPAPIESESELAPPCAGMNLAAALAAERQLRAALGVERSPTTPVGTPGRRVSLMRLLEETDVCDEDSVCYCCVCMGRKKDAAFIPCGHTFCRVCSRELWVNRGACPLCNRPIMEILDIY